MKQLKISSEKYLPTGSQGQKERGLLVGCFFDFLISMMEVRSPQVASSMATGKDRDFEKPDLNEWKVGMNSLIKRKPIVTHCLKLYLTFEISNNQAAKKNSNPSQIMDLK